MKQKQTSTIFVKPALIVMVSALLLTTMLCWLPSRTVQAATLPVACDAAALVAAINTANVNRDPDTINLTAGCTYTFTQVDNWWYGPNALPAIASPITIEGNGATLKILQTDASGTPVRRLRFFYIGADPLANGTFGFNTPGAGHLTLHNLTLTGGHQKGGDGGNNHGSGAGMGGAIFNQGYLTLSTVTLIGNLAKGGNGGQDDGGGLGGMGGAGFGGPVTPAGSKGGQSRIPLPPVWPPECPYGAGGGGFGPTENGSCHYGGGPQDGLGGDSWGGHGGHGSGGGGGLSYFPWGGSGGDFGFNNVFTNSIGNGGGGVGGGSIGNRGFKGTGEGGGGFGGGGINGGFGGGGSSNYARGGFGGGDGGGTDIGEGPGAGGAGMGGAIFNHGGVLTAIDSTFRLNAAIGGDGHVNIYLPISEPSTGASGLGGAIFNLNGAITLTRSSLISNTVITGALAGPKNEAAGGAVYNLGYNLLPGQVANLTIISSTLAQSLGGSDLVNDQPLNVPLAAGGGFNLAAAHLHLVGQNNIAFYHLNDTATIHGTGQGGWYTSAVTVTWTITDEQGTIVKQSGCTPQLLIGETAGTMFTCTVTRTAGIVSESELVKLDNTKPTTSAFTRSAPNARGWYTAPVTIGFDCYDGGSGIPEGNCLADQVLTTEGLTVTSSPQTVTDLAGNRSAPSRIFTVKIDKTPPTITAAAITAPNAHGWYTTTLVIVRFACADQVSGIPEGNCPNDQAFITEGTALTTSAQMVTDGAGNRSASSNSVAVSIDTTPPTIMATVPLPNGNGWYNNAVRVHYLCADAISGVPSSACPSDEILATDGITISSTSHIVTDAAGNRSAPSNRITVKLDKTKPACTVQATPAFLTPADHQLVTITTTVSVTDALSGPAGFNLESVTGNLVDSGQSDIRGWKPGTPSTQGQLRAEPGVSHQPRTYTLIYSGFDKAGNSVLCSTTVPVPAAQEDASVIFLPWISRP